jgi:hypothetical protein
MILRMKLPPSCWECPMKTCELPFSKTIPGRKLREYSYKRHPKCPITAIRLSKKIIHPEIN